VNFLVEQLSKPLVKVKVSGLIVAATVLFFVTGCQTASPDFESVDGAGSKPSPERSDTLKEGDTLRIEFPGAPNLNTRVQIRPDGKIVLSLVGGVIGEITAAGKTRGEMEKELGQLYSPQLVSKQVTVSVESSSFPVFVSGAVLRPGRITSDRPITALEAIMDAGVDHSRANLKAVKIIRNVNGKVENVTLNLDQVIKGTSQERPFYLKPSDIVFVPEKFILF
jgi:polysaccharide biosynthesis/export protein